MSLERKRERVYSLSTPRLFSQEMRACAKQEMKGHGLCSVEVACFNNEDSSYIKKPWKERLDGVK